MQHDRPPYIMMFAAIICVVCGVVVSTAAVSWASAQKVNAALDKQKNVLQAAGLIEPGQAVTAEEVTSLFENIDAVAYDLETKTEDPDFDLTGYDQRKASRDPATSQAAPPNRAAIQRVPHYAQVFKVRGDDGNLETVVLPIEGLGLWGTLFGFLAVDPSDLSIAGITYYEHKETPGLGGEVDNPRWKALWPGRKIYDGDEVAIEVIKGQAGPPAEDPYEVDGLSGATITSRGVTNMLDFWLGEDAYGPYLQQLAQREASY